MKMPVRVTINGFMLISLLSFVAAVWLPEHTWKLVGTAVIFLVAAVIMLSVVAPDFGKNK